MLARTLGTTVTFWLFGTACVAGSLAFAAVLPALQRAVRTILPAWRHGGGSDWRGSSGATTATCGVSKRKPAQEFNAQTGC